MLYNNFLLYNTLQNRPAVPKEFKNVEPDAYSKNWYARPGFKVIKNLFNLYSKINV